MQSIDELLVIAGDQASLLLGWTEDARILTLVAFGGGLMMLLAGLGIGRRLGLLESIPGRVGTAFVAAAVAFVAPVVMLTYVNLWIAFDCAHICGNCAAELARQGGFVGVLHGTGRFSSGIGLLAALPPLLFGIPLGSLLVRSRQHPPE